MLDYETRDSPTRLTVDAFEDPFDYKITTVSGSEEKVESVDLVETFNYLLGLHVERILAVKDGKRYYRAVRGRNPDEKRVLTVWRSTESLDLMKDKEFIEKTFMKDGTIDILYVNGMCHVKGARPIEPEFKKLMGA
jgi:adenine-specific DNA-methyltransferase